MVIKLNLNTLLVVLGGLGVFAPDAAFIATWLDHWNIHWLTYVAKIFGFLSVFFAAAPLAVPKLRGFLALFKLATPAGTVVPHPQLKLVPKDPDATPPPVVKDAGFAFLGRLLLLLALSLMMMAAWLIPRLARAEGTTAALPLPAPALAPAPLPTSAAQPPVTAEPLPAAALQPPATAAPAPASTFQPTATATPAPASTSQPTATATPAPASTSQPTATAAPAPASTSQPTATATSAPASTPGQAGSPYDSKYGGCKGNFCLAPALAMQAFQYVPATGDMTGGVAFAGGYGLVWHTMIDLGLAFYAAVQYSRDKTFTAQGLAMFNVANYFAFGPGFEMLGQQIGPAKFHLTICFAANWIPGLITR